MKKIFSYIALCITLCTTLCACEKTIEIPYRDIEPLTVIYANLSCADTKEQQISVSQTVNMSSNEMSGQLSNALVEITDPHGTTTTFAQGDSSYVSHFSAQVGLEYSLCVTVNQQTYTSQVIATPAAALTPILVGKISVAGMMEMIFANTKIMDKAGIENCYISRLLIDGRQISTSVVRDQGQDGMPINVLMSLPPYKSAEELEGEEQKDKYITDGQIVSIIVEEISREVYNYYEGLSISSTTGSNPVSCISGGALGCFAITTPVRVDYVFEYNGL